MANPFDQFDQESKKNAFDSFDQPEKPQPEVKPKEDPGVLDYLINSIKRGVISSASAIDALMNAGYSRIAATELLKKGEMPSEELMRRAYRIGEERKPIIQEAAEAQAASMRRLAPLTGAQVDMRAPGTVSRYLGAGLEAAFDPLSYLGGGAGLIKTPVRATGEFLTGVLSELGGEAGAGVERAITGGEETGVGRLVGGVTAGVGTAVPRQTLTDTLGNTIEQIRKNREILKTSPGGAERAYATGASKRLLEIAAKEQGSQSVDALISLVNDASRFVNKSDAPLVIAMADNPVIRQQVERLAKTNPSFRQRVNELVAQASTDIESKTTRMFGEPYGAEVKPEAGLKVAPVVARKRQEIEKELSDLTAGVTPTVTKEQLGQRVEALVEERKKAARAEVSPEYDELLADARANKVEMPSDGVGVIYKFVEENNLRDIFGKGTALDKKIMSYLEPKKQKPAVTPEILGPDGKPISAAEAPAVEYPPMSFDNVESLKKAINELKRKTMSDDAMRKVLQLEEVVDEARATIPGDYSQRLNDIDLRYYEKVGIPFSEQGIKEIDAKKYAEQIAPVIVKTPEAYGQFVRAVGKEKGNALAENAIIAEVYQKAVKDGMLNAGQLEKYLKDKAGIISQIPGLGDRLRQAALDDRQIRAQLDSLDTAAKAAEARVANNALTQFEVPDYGTLASNIINNPRQRQKIMRDIGDLDPDTAKAVRNALRVEVINIGRRNADGFMAYVMDPKNKSGIEAVFGTAFQPSLRKLALFSDKVGKADVSKLGVAIDRRELDALARLLPGVDIPYISSNLRDRITSFPQKVVRVLSKYNSAKLASATDDAIMELLLDPNGVQKLANTISDVKFEISNPASVQKLADSLSRSVPRSFYTSGKTVLAGEERERIEKEAVKEKMGEFVTGGFEDELEMPTDVPEFNPEKKAKGGPVYSADEKNLLKKYASR